MKRKVQWCYVGDTIEKVKSRKHKRIFIADVGGDYPILTVDIDSGAYYIEGYYFRTVVWKYCELIKEPEYIPFDATNIEDVKQLVGKVLVGKKHKSFFIPNGNITQQKLDQALEDFTFEDGSPVGKVKE